MTFSSMVHDLLEETFSLKEHVNTKIYTSWVFRIFKVCYILNQTFEVITS